MGIQDAIRVGGGERDVRLPSPYPRPRQFQAQLRQARASVLTAQQPGRSHAVASGQWSASSGSTIGSSYWIERSGVGGGGRSDRSHSFRWRRIFSMTGASPIRLMILRGPEQRGQTKGSAS